MEALGMEVTVKAYVWGRNGLMDGGWIVPLGDKPLEGMQQAKVSLWFTEEDDDSQTDYLKDEEITFSGVIRQTAPEIRIGNK